MKHPDKLTRSEAAAALGITAKTLASWEKEGKIEAPERDWRGWRLYDPEKVAEIRRMMLGGDETTQPSLAIPGLELSARNRLTGVVTEISGDSVLCEIVLDIGGGQEVVGVITRNSVRRLGLRVGDRASAIVKATDVMIAR
jgi:molybdopterin-binding protein